MSVRHSCSWVAGDPAHGDMQSKLLQNRSPATLHVGTHISYVERRSPAAPLCFYLEKKTLLG